jgi:hypothetical protein
MLAAFVFSPAHINAHINGQISGQINRKMTP